MKKIFLLMAFVMVLSAFSVVASQPSDFYHGWDFISNSSDINQTANLSVTGALFGASSGKLDGSYTYDSTNSDFLNTSDVDSLDPDNSDFSFSYWIKITGSNTDTWQVPLAKYGGLDGYGCEVNDEGAGDDGKLRCFLKDSSTRYNSPYTASIKDGSYHHIVVNFDRDTNMSLFVDGVYSTHTTQITGIQGSIANTHPLYFGAAGSVNFLEGNIDEIFFYRRVLNNDEISYLYNSGNAQKPYNYTPPPSGFDRSTEKVIEFNQTGSFILNSQSYKPIMIDEVNFTENMSYYATYGFNAIPVNNDGTITCDIAINDVRQGNPITRSVSEDYYGSLYISSGILEAYGQPINISLECFRTAGTGSVILNNGKLITHGLLDAQGDELQNGEVSTSFSVDTTSYESEPLSQSQFTTSTKANNTDSKKVLVIDGHAEYDYSGNGNISLLFSVNGVNSSEYPRYGSSGSTGIVGGNFLYEMPDDYTAGDNVTLAVYSKYAGDTSPVFGSVTLNSIIKELVLHKSEYNYVSLNDTHTNSTDYITLKSFTVNNTNVTNGRIVVHASIPYFSEVSSRNVFRISLSDENGSSIIRDVSTPYNTGVAIINEVFIRSAGTYTVSLQAKTNGTINVTGGDMTAYLSRDLEGSPNTYEVRAYNEWTGNAISNFTVTDSTGNSYMTDEGFVDVFQTGGATENLTLMSEGYFNKTVINHNVFTDLNASIYGVEVLFNAKKVGLNTLITGGNYTIGGVTYASGVKFNLSEGLYNVTFAHPDYYSKTQEFNFSALYNGTSSVTGVYNTLLTINVTDVVTGETLPNETTVYFGNGTSQFSYSNETGYFTAGVLNETLYPVILETVGYATYFDNVTFNGSTYDYNISLYTNNSIWVYAKDINTGNALSDFTVELYNVNSSSTLNDSGTGVLKFEDITSGIYTAKITKVGYDTTYYVVTMTGGSHLNLNSYLTQNASSTVFTILNIETGNILVNAQIDQYKTINGSVELIQSRISDITGRASFNYVAGTEYRFVVTKTGYNDLTFNLEPLYSTYNIRITPTGNGGSDTVGWNYYINNSNFFDKQTNNFTISITSGYGSIEYYNLTVTTPNGTEYITNCDTAQGCSTDYQIPLNGVVDGDYINVYFEIKESGKSETSRNFNYVIMGVYGDNTVQAWQSSDLGVLERVFFATLLLILMLGIVSTASVFAGLDPVIPAGTTLLIMSWVFGNVGFIPVWGAWIIGLFGVLLIVFKGVTL